jgi:subtilisin family serine protease
VYKKSGRNLKRKSVALLLATLMLATSGVAAFAENATPIDLQVSEDIVVANVYPGTRQIMITEEQVEALNQVQSFSAHTGLVGFEDDLALPSDDTQVPVLVFFESNPASTQVYEAAISGLYLTLDEAMQNVESQHTEFRNELASLFGVTPFSLGTDAAPVYHVTTEFRHTFNGVSMTLPANMAEAVANLNVVRAVFPDFPLNPPDVVEELDDDVIQSMFPAFEPGDDNSADLGREVWGGLQGRDRMNAHELHDRGYDGSGIIIAVIDSGIDWMHPAFAGSFPPAEVIYEARIARFGPNGTAGHRPELVRPLWDGTNNPGGYNELFNVNRYAHGDLDTIGRPVTGEAPDYRFVGRDHMRLWPGGLGDDPRSSPLQRGGSPGFSGATPTWTYPVPLPPGMPGNNPMEASPLYFATDAGADMRPMYELWQAGPGGLGTVWGTHGTHVSGSILGRPFGDDPGAAIMGVAPGAWGVHYRGLYGGQRVYASVWISGQEWAFLDGATVANMSLGYQMAAAVSVMNNSVNNLMLADPTMVFTISAGNSGTNFFSGGNPGGSIMAITVSALNEPLRGRFIESPAITMNEGRGRTTFVTHRDNARVIELENGNQFINHPNPAVHVNGEMRIFPMGGVPLTAAVPVGTGTVAQFNQLIEEHGEALSGHFVLVNRGEAFVDVATRAYNAGLRGVISINGTLAGGYHQAPGVINATGAPASINPVPVLQILNTEGVEMARSIVDGEAAFTTFTITDEIFAFGVGTAAAGTVENNLLGLPNVQAFSSRGPLGSSFTITPDIGAHGVNVFSSHPRHSAGLGLTFAQLNANHAWRNTPFSRAFANSSGTSMSAPHVAGAVALMQQYSRDNNLGNYNGKWGNYEIRTRIMNTAIELNYPGNIYSPFDGARNIDVWAATQTNSVVFAEYTKVPTVLFVPNNSPAQVHETTLKGSFSFGGFNVHAAHTGEAPGTPAANGVRNIGARAGSYTIRAFIDNNSDTAITYNITHEFLGSPRPARPANSPTSRIFGATLTHPGTVNVPPGERVGFDVTINLPEGSDVGFFEGSLTVTGGSHPIVLPIAAVAYSEQPTFEFLGLYRPVITTNEEAAQNVTSSELVMYYSQSWGFAAVFYLIDRAAVREAQAENPDLGFGPDTWLRSTINPDGTHSYVFEEFILGTTMQTAYDYANRWSRYFPRNRGGGLSDETMRGVIFDGYYTPGTWESPAGQGELQRLDRSGEFYIGMSVFRQTPTATLPGAAIGHSGWVFWERSLLIPFYVDNEAPEINAVTINGIEVDADSPEIVQVSRNTTDIVIAGNVSDLWLTDAMNSNVAFDVFLNSEDAAVSLDNLALWVQVDDNTPVRAVLTPDGDFEKVFENVLENTSEVKLWLIDGYAPVPVVNQTPIGVGNPHAGTVAGWWNIAPTARTLQTTSYFTPAGFVEIGQTDMLRSDVVFGRAGNNNPEIFNLPATEFNRFAYSGLNVTELVIEVTQTARGTLSESVEIAENLVREDFTASAWTRTQSALTAARRVLDNPNATQAQIEAALRNLDNLIR